LKQTIAQAILLPAAAAILLGLNISAHADTLILGSPSGGNAFPFGNYGGEYQEDYAGSLFTGPIVISSIGFESSTGFTATADDTFTISLAPTTVAPGSLSTTYADNETTPLTQVFSGTESATLLGTDTPDYIIPITPFTYDPTGGQNLLMDIDISNLSGTGIVAFSQASQATIGRVFNVNGFGSETSTDQNGLVTILGETPVATPEPSPLGALAVGLAMVTGLLVYKKKRKA